MNERWFSTGSGACSLSSKRNSTSFLTGITQIFGFQNLNFQMLKFQIFSVPVLCNIAPPEIRSNESLMRGREKTIIEGEKRLGKGQRAIGLKTQFVDHDMSYRYSSQAARREKIFGG